MLPAHSRVLYLHGFASGPASRKATFFAAKLRALGFRVDVPDLSEGDFQSLTLTRQLAVIEALTGSEPVLLIGSSMGAYLAALFAANHPSVLKLVLLAPAFGIYSRWTEQLGPERLASWQAHGTISVFHYAAGHELPIGFELIQDASRYPPFPDFTQPALILHGLQDSVAPVQFSLEFASQRSNVKLITFESGHELTDVMDEIWAETQTFLLDSEGLLRC